MGIHLNTLATIYRPASATKSAGYYIAPDQIQAVRVVDLTAVTDQGGER
jgi:hypothetical protein